MNSLRILRDVWRGRRCVFRAGEILRADVFAIQHVAPPPGYAGFRGWFVRHGRDEWSLEDGVDAEEGGK